MVVVADVDTELVTVDETDVVADEDPVVVAVEVMVDDCDLE